VLERELLLCDSVEAILATNPDPIALYRLITRLQWLTYAANARVHSWHEMQAGRGEIAREHSRVASAAVMTAREVPEDPRPITPARRR
jgi:hypothetical protein